MKSSFLKRIIFVGVKFAFEIALPNNNVIKCGNQMTQILVFKIHDVRLNYI